MKRDYIDLAYIPIHQDAIHKRLENWASAMHNKEPRSVHPMFRQYRSSEVWGGEPVRESFDLSDAMKVNSAVSKLPLPHAQGLHWFYILKDAPIKARKRMGCTYEALNQYVIDGRQMLINRRT